jgi:CPA1 family monovalent cation:H+ antiporter
LSLAGLLTLASLLLPLSRWTGFPFTVLLALAGIVLALLAPHAAGVRGFDVLFEFLHALDSLDITSDIVFFVFLPALIFSSALGIELRRIIADLRPILLLAVVGLLISTVVSGGAIWLVSGSTFFVCLLVGAIISATDPVAVIAIFKDLGAPKRLTILVEGESLFNDATAIVAFSILAAVVAGSAELTAVGTLQHFTVVFLGGVFVGLVIAVAAAHVIERLHDMPTAEITLTLCLAYLVFILAEHYLHVSGVIAVVAAGLVTGSYGRTRISPKTWPGLKEIWGELEFWANSLIFFLVGLAVPNLMREFTLADGMALVVLLIAGFATRAAVIFGLLPLTAQAGLMRQVNRAYQTVMVWGGLRGAVSLALALLVLESDRFSAETQHFVGTLVTGFVLFTLFVNAPAMRFVLRFLKLHELSPRDRELRNRALGVALAQCRNSLEEAARIYQIEDSLGAEIRAETETRQAETLKSSDNLAATDISTLDESERQQIALITLLNLEHHTHLKLFKSNLLSPAIARALLYRGDLLLDATKLDGISGYRRAVEQNVGFRRAFRAALWCHRRIGVAWPLAMQLALRFELLLATLISLRELERDSKRVIGALLGPDAFNDMMALLAWRIEVVERNLQALELQYPEYLKALRRRHLQRVSIRMEEASYEEMYEEEVIGTEVFTTLWEDLESRWRQLEKRPSLDIGMDTPNLVRRVPYLSALGDEEVGAVAALLRPVFVVPGERLVTKGEEGREMFFISSGAVEVATEPDPVRLGSGEFFGEMALVMSAPRVADVTALGFCRLLRLSTSDFHQLLKAYPELEKVITAIAHERREDNIAAPKRQPEH